MLSHANSFWSDLQWNDSLSYRKAEYQLEMQHNVYNFEVSSTEMLFQLFEMYEQESKRVIETPVFWDGEQDILTTSEANAIAVRDPSVYWDGTKAVFSMLIGAPTQQYQVQTYVWQLYEITGLGQNQTPVITKVANQPANYNNVSPLYGTDDRIIFTTDRARADAGRTRLGGAVARRRERAGRLAVAAHRRQRRAHAAARRGFPRRCAAR